MVFSHILSWKTWECQGIFFFKSSVHPFDSFYCFPWTENNSITLIFLFVQLDMKINISTSFLKDYLYIAGYLFQ